MRKINSLLGLVLSLVALFVSSNTVHAEEVITNENADQILADEIIANNYDTYDSINVSDLYLNNGVSTISLLGDQYEDNDSFSNATTGMIGTKIHATLHNENDWDFYRIDIADPNEYYSFVLTDIPNGCDYQMVVVDDTYTGWANYSSGNSDEFFVRQFDSSELKTYYVIVYSVNGSSDSEYTLYFGKSYKNGNTGWINPNMSFNFGNVSRGSYKKLSYQVLDLTNSVSIPVSVMTQLYVSSEGNSGQWAGFYKYVRPESGNEMSIIGNLEAFSVPDMTYYVKQRWSISGSVQYSQYFTWTPRILIGYKYIVTPETMRFLP